MKPWLMPAIIKKFIAIVNQLQRLKLLNYTLQNNTVLPIYLNSKRKSNVNSSLCDSAFNGVEGKFYCSLSLRSNLPWSEIKGSHIFLRQPYRHYFYQCSLGKLTLVICQFSFFFVYLFKPFNGDPGDFRMDYFWISLLQIFVSFLVF